MVARDAGTLEWQSPTSPAGICDHQVRCISPGLGGSMQRHQDRRPVRTIASHKLPRVACSNSGSKIISEGSRRIISFTTAGQPDSCGLHQQHGGNSVTPVDRSSQSLVVMSSFQGHCPVSRTYSQGQ